MSNERNEHQRDDPGRLSTATLIRLRADGESTEAEAAELARRRDEAGAARGEAFERRLRERVGRVMGETTAPAGLRERIESAMRADGGEAPAPIVRRERSFWSGAGRGLALLAATLALAAGVAIIFQQAPSSGARSAVASALMTTAGQLRDEHTGCLTDQSYFASKMREPAEGGAAPQVRALLSGAPASLRLDRAGYTLAGLGPCEMEGEAVHLLYRPPTAAAEHRAPASLFIQRRSDSGLDEGVVYVSDELGEGCMLRVWRDGDLVYYLVTACPVACEEAARVYELPDRRVRL